MGRRNHVKNTQAAPLGMFYYFVRGWRVAIAHCRGLGDERGRGAAHLWKAGTQPPGPPLLLGC